MKRSRFTDRQIAFAL
jgi:putative transposase